MKSAFYYCCLIAIISIQSILKEIRKPTFAPVKRVVVGMSGGVDSSVAALKLLEEGYEVIGLFMKNWHDTSVTISDDCPWVEDSYDAQLVADQLGIPIQTIDLSKEYKERIVDYMFREYEAGRTPNPDVLCNREIKFDVFLKAALQLGADYVATGHYCRKDSLEISGKETFRLLAGADANKDQSYFLCQVNQEQLSKALFPIGDMEKSDVRKMAEKAGLVTAGKKDSQGLCFIGKVKLPDFLQQQLKPKAGDVIEIDSNDAIYASLDSANELEEMTAPYSYSKTMGKKVGTHNGAHYFTIGQRKGLGIGGTPEALFVVHTDTKENIVYTGQGHDFPGLIRKGLFVPSEDAHWVRKDLKLDIGAQKEFDVRIRYRQPLEKAKLIARKNGVYVLFEKPIWGIAPGQFVAWYNGEELIGSGVIS